MACDSKILVCEPDPDVLEILVASLSRRFDAHITCTADAATCLDAEVTEPHDLVIAELDDGNGQSGSLIQQLIMFGPRPVIVLADRPSRDDLVRVVRAGVADIFCKPFPVEELLSSAREQLDENNIRRQKAVKYRRMRDMVRRVVRERRDLNRRMNLVCQDLVGAHRRLVERVLAIRGTKPQATE